MHHRFSTLRRKGPVGIATLSLTALWFLSAGMLAQQPRSRVAAEIDDLERVTLKGTHPLRATPENDIGRVASGTKLQGIKMAFSRTATQEVDLQTLLAAQQNPSSSLYHKWLSPEEFAARFGLADPDIATVRLWLERQGFSVASIARSKNYIVFSGTVGQVEAAFQTEEHDYKSNGETHFAPASDINIPAALASVVQNVTNLTSFRPHARVKFRPPQRATKANFTSSQSGDHFLTPKDLATIYDINPAYNAGYTGSGQSIAVVGQSTIALSDIENFQSAAGFTKKDPSLVLVPNSGTGTTVSGDEAESDIDLEYASTIGKGATIYFVYVGNNSNYSVWDSIQYAVDNKIAPIISDSYGSCETALSSSDYSTLNGVLEQAAAQGETVLGPSGDNGSTDCYGDTTLTAAEQEALAVDFPASSQYVTGMGGSEFPASDVSSSNTTYWESASGSDVISSARSYIPEQVWNDDSSSSGLAAGGGGTSALTARPSWQTGVTGIPSGSYRLVPDISLSASPDDAGYLYCSSDSASTGVTGGCSNGFRDSNDTYLTVAGGTSFGGPIFAGMLAILNQKLNSSGLGAINSTLYTLAADSTTYASAFHDITSGSNECTAGSSYCSSAGDSEYPATTGYDEATGLGSVDFFNLLAAWPTGSSSSPGFSLNATNVTVSAGNSGTSTITITPNNGYTGTITWTISSTPSLSNGCYVLGNTTVSGASAITANMTIYTNSTACSNTGFTGPGKRRFLFRVPIAFCAATQWSSELAILGISLVLATFLFSWIPVFQPWKFGRLIVVTFLLAVVTCSLSSCSGSSKASSSSTSYASTGTYTLTIVGKDSSSSSITVSTTMTLTID
jgi:subtilase family serine protease